MAKARLVRPEIWTDGRFVALSPLARLLFVGMWNYACDNGHVADSDVELKMRVLPADECDVSELLDEVLDSEMVVRKDGYLKVVNLSEKQPLDLRFLVFCGHCEDDLERHYSPEDKKPSRGAPASSTGASRVSTTGARRSGGVDGGVDGGGNAKSTRKRATTIPDDFEPNDTNHRVAKEHGVDLSRVLPNFADHHRAKGSTYKDWNLALNTWIRRERPTQAPQLAIVTNPADLPPVEESWMRRRPRR